MRILTSRCVRTRRFAALSWQRIAEVICVAVITGMFWFQVGVLRACCLERACAWSVLLLMPCGVLTA